MPRKKRGKYYDNNEKHKENKKNYFIRYNDFISNKYWKIESLIMSLEKKGNYTKTQHKL